MKRARELRDPNDIVLSQHYPFTVARLFIPSHAGDGPVTLTTMHNWRKANLFPFTYRVQPRRSSAGSKREPRRSYFIRGADIIALIGIEPAAKPVKQSRARASSMETLRGAGFKNA